MPHLDAAYTLARYLAREEHAAWDVVQEASLRAFRYLDTFRGDDARGWFLTIVRNCFHNLRRGDRTDREIAFDAGDSADHVPGPESADAAVIAESERAWIWRAVESLPAEYREVVVLREIEELSYTEISHVVGAPIGTVKSRIARARRRLAELLGERVLDAG